MHFVEVAAELAAVQAHAVFDGAGIGGGGKVDGDGAGGDYLRDVALPVVNAITFTAGDEAPVDAEAGSGFAMEDGAVFIAENQVAAAIEAEQRVEAGGADVGVEVAVFVQCEIDAHEVAAGGVEADGAAMEMLGKWRRTERGPCEGGDGEQDEEADEGCNPRWTAGGGVEGVNESGDVGEAVGGIWG